MRNEKAGRADIAGEKLHRIRLPSNLLSYPANPVGMTTGVPGGVPFKKKQ